MSDFTYVPATSGTSLSKEPRTLRTQFGDGYQQRIADGINTQPATWNLTFNVVEADADVIEALFAGWRGVDAFTWTPPGTKSEIAVICTKWQRSYNSAHTATIAATFEEVFDSAISVATLNGGVIQDDSHSTTTISLSITTPATGGQTPRTRVWQKNGVDIPDATGTTVVVMGLTPGVTYDIQLQTTDALGAIALSNTVSVTTLSLPGLAVTINESVAVTESRTVSRTSGFTPASLANLWGWYKKGIWTASAGKVATWQDQSGNNRSLENNSSGGAFRPTDLTAYARFISANFTSLDTGAQTLASHPISMWVRCRPTAWTSGASIISGFAARADVLQSGSTPALVGYNGITGFGPINPTLNTWIDLFVGFDTAGTATSFIRYDNNAAVTADLITDQVPAGGISLGCNFGPGGWADVDVMELAVYSSLLSQSDCNSLHAYGAALGSPA